MFWIFWKHFLEGSEGVGASGVDRTARNTSYNSYPKAATSPSDSITHTDLAEAYSSFGNDVFCVLDKDLNCLFLSGNWQVITGFSTEEGMADGLQRHICPEHIKKVAGYLSLADRNIPALRFRMKQADEEWHWCEIQVVGVERTSRTRETHYRCLLRNINELVSAQHNYERARLEADVANKSRSEFLANMNHELRTPLNAIIGFAQMMESGIYGEVGHPKYNDYIGNIQQSGHTLLTKVNNLIDIANIDSGSMKLDEARHDIRKLVQRAIEFHSHRAFSEQITLRETLPDRPLCAVIDEVRILQALSNVISNAVKYNRAGGCVDVYCEVRKDGGISIVVEDDGEGIAASHLERILSAFGQDNSFFARTRNCVGLGLALSKEIIKMHGGRIDIESAPGKGTILTIMLPASRTVASAPELVKKNSQQGAENPATGGKRLASSNSAWLD